MSKKYPKFITLDEIWDMLFDSYPKDMENFSERTHSQSHRMIEKFWEMLEDKTNK